MNSKIFNHTKHLIIIISFFASFSTYGQRDASKAIGTPYIGVQYGVNWTGGELADRYGLTNALGSHAGYKTKRNWIYGVDGNFFFGMMSKLTVYFRTSAMRMTIL